MNYRVVGIDTGEDKRALLEGYGIHKFIDFMVEKVRPSGGIANGCAQDIASRVKEMTGGHARAAVVTAGSIGPYKQVSRLFPRLSKRNDAHGCALGVDIPRLPRHFSLCRSPQRHSIRGRPGSDGCQFVPDRRVIAQ